uniref:Uncharacterized protein n=1 Tax=Acrobeloides nanus TaxID=290746 RepID=A0A914D196_9BILA
MKNLRLIVDCQPVRSGKLSNVGPSGQWNGTKTAAIVDLMPRVYCTYPDVKKILLGNHRMNWDDIPTDLLLKCRLEKRLEIAKKGSEALVNTVTDDFNDYINAVKNNVKKSRQCAGSE